MSLTPEKIVQGLRALLGEARTILAEPAEMASYLSEPRKRFHTPAVAVALPGSVAALQALCRWANEHRVPLIPQSGNTGLVGGQVPLGGDEVIVNLSRINRVRGVDAAAGYMTELVCRRVGAG